MKPFHAFKKQYRFLLVAGLFLFVPALLGHAQSAADIQSKIDQSNANIAALEKEIAGYQSQLDSIGKQKSTLAGDIALLDISRKKLAASINVTQNQIDATTLKIQTLGTEIGTKEDSIATAEVAIGNGFRLMNEYDLSNTAATLLSSQDFTTLWNEVDSIATVRDSMRDQIADLRQIKGDLEDTRTDTTAARTKLVALKSQLADQKKIVDQNTADKNKLLAQTKDSETSYQKLLADREAKKNAFEQELASYESQLKYLLTPGTKLPTGAVLSWPLDSVYVTNPFGKNSSGLYVTGLHNGVDFRASVGTPVYAMADGVVDGTGDTDVQCPGVSFGRFVLIKYDVGLASTFGHLSLIKVTKGERVTRGEVVGYSGATGYVTGPHLHVSVYARDAVNVETLPSKSCPGHDLTQPIPTSLSTSSPYSAYLDPMQFLPPYSGTAGTQRQD